jgi:hypothetical protein
MVITPPGGLNQKANNEPHAKRELCTESATESAHYIFPSIVLPSRKSWRILCDSAFASKEYKPCFQRARRDRARPSEVRGPVLAPPCIRQRPLRIAGAIHSLPCRVLAPHRGAFFGSPGGLPFFNHPKENLEILLPLLIVSPIGYRIGLVHSPHDRLPSFMNVDVFNNHSCSPLPL